MTEDMLASWRAKYSIPISVEMVVLDPIDRASASPVGCVALDSTILNSNLRLSFPRVIFKFLSFWKTAPT